MQQPYWPYGPGEKEQWERLLKERPDLAPAVEKLGNTKSTNGGGLPVGTKEKLTQSEKSVSANGDLGNSSKTGSKRVGNIAWQMEKRESELRQGASDAGNRINDELAKAETQSKIRRTPDGDAPWLELANTYRSERLQALGNGVVPLTAALAFSVLWERMKENE